MAYRNYSDPQYKEWRQKIYARDRFSCQWPGCTNKKKVEAHHILRWADYPGLRYHLDNGITLCKYHHQQINGNEDSYIKFFTDLIMRKKDG